MAEQDDKEYKGEEEYTYIMMVVGQGIECAFRVYLMSPYPTVVIVTTAHQNASGIDLKKDISAPASAK